jgi:hypothetical protein
MHLVTEDCNVYRLSKYIQGKCGKAVRNRTIPGCIIEQVPCDVMEHWSKYVKTLSNGVKESAHDEPKRTIALPGEIESV